MNEKLEYLKDKIRIDAQNVCHDLVQDIIKSKKEFKKQRVIVGLSGGLDSSVVTVLCVRALGKDMVKALLLPDSESSQMHLRDSFDLVRELGIPWEVIDITPFLRDLKIKKYGFASKIPFQNKIKGFLFKKAYQYYQSISGETPFASKLKGQEGKPYHNYIQRGQAILQAKNRFRMAILYYYAELEGRIVVGCTNKTEQHIGLFVKYGCDHLADIMPIIGLYKTQVRRLAKYLNISNHLIEKEPSPDLLPGLDDRTMIGLPYEEIDLILLAKENGLPPEEISQLLGIALEQIVYVFDLAYYAGSLR
ncbi:MAG: NAD(+) synthase [Atribacterota bacterium]|nr:NAD(+) synthase [Atribacterota bacterium]MDD4895745.1 NAD(+) synthase [Atribacterota bacterium]MDD5636760.1 NAD(+) synthase [Atribacterota bacterium]